MAYAIYFALIARIGPVRTNLVAYVAGFALVERRTLRDELARLRRRLVGASGAPARDSRPED